MFILYDAMRNWGWECFPNKAREEKPIANCYVPINIPRSFVGSAAPAIMQRECKGMVSYSNRRGHIGNCKYSN